VRNLGALFTHDGQSETIYSTSTVDTPATGTTTIDYWAQVPGAEWLHVTRDVVVEGAANDNQATSSPPITTASSTPPLATSTPSITSPANDNLPLPVLTATGPDATSSAQ
jgi:hypothetical protein